MLSDDIFLNPEKILSADLKLAQDVKRRLIDICLNDDKPMDSIYWMGSTAEYYTTDNLVDITLKLWRETDRENNHALKSHSVCMQPQVGATIKIRLEHINGLWDITYIQYIPWKDKYVTFAYSPMGIEKSITEMLL